MIRPRSALPTVRLILLAGFALILTATPLSAEVFGLKSKDPISGPPTHLFKFNEDGSAFTDLGAVTVNGSGADLDGMAWSPVHGLLAYQMTTGGSQLVQLSLSPPVGVPIGTLLAGREIRGAVFDFDDRLLVIDSDKDELVEIDPVTGAEIGAAIPLTENGAPFDLSNVSDIALRADGTFIISSLGLSSDGTLHELDRETGDVLLLHTLTVGYLSGIAFSRDTLSDDHLFGYEVQNTDDILYVEMDSNYAVTVLHTDIIPSFNAGRGDLAALVEPAPLRADRTYLHAPGGVVNFTFAPGTGFAGRKYLLLATLSGTSPGTPLPGGTATLPLNRDGVTDFIIANLSKPWFTGFFGTLDGTGTGTARLDTPGPLPAAFVGKTMHFACATAFPWDFASNAIAVEIAP